MRKKYCPHCDFTISSAGLPIKNAGDKFILCRDEASGDVTLCTDERRFYILKVNFCPMCGRAFDETTKNDLDKLKKAVFDAYISYDRCGHSSRLYSAYIEAFDAYKKAGGTCTKLYFEKSADSYVVENSPKNLPKKKV